MIDIYRYRNRDSGRKDKIVSKCSDRSMNVNFPQSLKIMTDGRTDRPSNDRRTERGIGKLDFNLERVNAYIRTDTGKKKERKKKRTKEGK